MDLILDIRLNGTFQLNKVSALQTWSNNFSYYLIAISLWLSPQIQNKVNPNKKNCKYKK